MQLDDHTPDDRPLDDHPLDRAPLAPVQETPARRSAMPVVLVTIVGLALGAAAAWWWSSRPPDAEPAPASTSPAAATDMALPAEEAPAPLPPLSEMDPLLRKLIGALSSHPELARWLATDDLVRQMARGIDRVSRGQTPINELSIYRPSGEFRVTGRRGELTIDPASYRRYDRFAEMVASVDAQGVADVYRTIYPRLDEAYRALGRAESGVDRAVNVVLQELIETPVPDGPIRVVPGPGATYAYADPQLERLSPVQKQLLRMGPENARRIQAKLREIQQAIEAAPPR